MSKAIEEFYFLTETAIDPSHVKTEIVSESNIDIAGKKVSTLTFDTTLQSADVMNWNGKKYPKPWLAESLDSNAMIQNDIKHDQWIGEYGHPLGEGLSTPQEKAMRQAMIQPDKASHKINKYWWVGNLLKGRITTLPSGYGINVRDNTLAGVIPSFSFRGMGKVNPRTKEVLRGLVTTTFDYVFRPSHKEAYGDQIVSLNEAAVEAIIKDFYQSDASQSIPLQEAAAFINELVQSTSENAKRVMDLLETSNGYLAEDLSTYYVQHEGTTILVPVEREVRKNIKKILLP